MGGAGFWRRVGYGAARLGLVVGFCLLEWWWLQGLWEVPIAAFMLAAVFSQMVLAEVERRFRVSDPSVRSEWLWPAPGVGGPLGKVEIRVDEGRYRRLGSMMVYGGLTLLVIATVGAGVQAWWFGGTPIGFSLGMGLAIFVMIRGMIWSLQNLSTPLMTVDAEGLKTFWNKVPWASVTCCEIRTELNLRGEVTNIYPVLHGTRGLRIPTSLKGDFSIASPEDRERLLDWLRVRLVAHPAVSAVN